MTIDQAIQLGIQHHQAGRLAAAEAVYRQILATSPNQPDALHLLGLAAFQSGRLDEAIHSITRAIATNPSAPHFHSSLGQVLFAKGQIDQAIQSYQQALRLHPDFGDAYNNLGSALMQKGDFDSAAKAYRRAVKLRPDSPEAHNNLGNLFLARRDFDKAIESLQRAIALRPQFAQAHANLAQALHGKGKLDESLNACRQAISLQPGDYITHNTLGNVLMDAAQVEEAIAAYRKALELRPDFVDALNNLGNALRRRGRHSEAETAFLAALKLRPDLAAIHNNLSATLFDQGRLEASLNAARQAVKLDPNLADAHNNIGTVLLKKGEVDQALESFDQAIALRQDFPRAHLNRGMVLLLRGDYEQGWPEYAWRAKVSGAFRFRPSFNQTQWNGEDLRGRTILLHAEQGFGDTIQFARYVPLVMQRGGNVLLGVQPELRRLLAGMEGIKQILTPDQPLPAFDVQCPLPSLPAVFQTKVETIPSNMPYLSAIPDPALSLPLGNALKVGLVWSGRTEAGNDLNRPIALADLAPLAETGEVQFHSLQTGSAADQAAHRPAGMNLTSWGDWLDDFTTTAALIANLDLLITVDTAVAHLAGAMGKPVWVLIPFAPDWRWMLNREDSPWYPTMKLFRQPAIGDWTTPVRRMADSLRKFRETR